MTNIELHKKNLKDLQRDGFTRSSHDLLYYIRKRSDIDFRIFRPGMTGSSGGRVKYSSFDIFGDCLVYYYLYDKKELFVNFIVKKFYNRNPNPDKSMKSAFTRILHINNLHWSGCLCNTRYNKISSSDVISV